MTPRKTEPTAHRRGRRGVCDRRNARATRDWRPSAAIVTRASCLTTVPSAGDCLQTDGTAAVRRQRRPLHQDVLFDDSARGRGRFDKTGVQHISAERDPGPPTTVKSTDANTAFAAHEHAVQQQPAFGDVRQIQPPQDRERTRIDRIATQLRPGKTGAVEQRDFDTGAGQHQGRNRPGGTGPRNHHVMHGRARWRCSSNRIRDSCTSAASTDVARPTLGMTSTSHCGSGSAWLMVGGRNASRIANAAVTMPAAPLAPCGWPIIDFVEDPATRSALATEELADAARLDGVVQDRRRPVIVDVADVLFGAARPLDRETHRADDLFALGIHLDAMIGVAGRSIAVHRRVDAGAARQGPVLAFEHQHPRPFTEDEAVARLLERARRFGTVVVVARRHCTHLREAEDHPRRDARVGAAGQQHVGLAAPDQRRSHTRSRRLNWCSRSRPRD